MRVHTPASARILGLCLGVLVLLANAAPWSPRVPADALREAGQNFLQSLDESSRARASLPFDAKERTRWQYTPGPRPGISMGELSDAQRRSVHSLLQIALSSRGYLKAQGIMELESVLRRDSGLYWISFFGDPSAVSPWGFKFEGHHLSLNFTTAPEQECSALPAFFGSNPAEVRQGSRAGWRVLFAEEDLAWQLMESLEEPQQQQARIAVDAPADIVWTPQSIATLDPASGIPASVLSRESRALLIRLIEEFAQNLHRDLAEAELGKLRESGINALQFSWAGSLKRGEPHYYRIYGPTLLIELDNVQDGANHVHAVWTQPGDEFGREILRRHTESAHGRK